VADQLDHRRELWEDEWAHEVRKDGAVVSHRLPW
jgi:hypothetical protein